jgi:hypothetical protein
LSAIEPHPHQPEKANGLAKSRTKLRIPDDQVQTLGTLASISERDMGRLLNLLADLPLTIDFEPSFKTLVPKLGFLEEPEKVLQVLLNLNVTRAHSDPPINEFVEDVLKTLGESDPKILAGKKKLQARQNLRKLLSFEPLNIAAKASHLLADQERLLMGVRILTDARPVYGQDPKQKPVAMLINHTLKLTYSHRHGEVDELYIALDADDIGNLKRALDRAIVKAESLASVLKSANIRIVQS